MLIFKVFGICYLVNAFKNHAELTFDKLVLDVCNLLILLQLKYLILHVVAIRQGLAELF